MNSATSLYRRQTLLVNSPRPNKASESPTQQQPWLPESISELNLFAGFLGLSLLISAEMELATTVALNDTS